MAYSSLEECLLDLECNGHLVRVKEEVDPKLQMAAIHLRVHASGGPAILFEKVKGSPFRAVSNVFGTIERCNFLFRDTLKNVQQVIGIKNNPTAIIRNPFSGIKAGLSAFSALPLKNPWKKPVLFQEIPIGSIPQIVHWPMDGGAFITLPQVYSEDLDKPGIMQANLGMYRIQMSGNEYVPDKEIGLHYQIHRGIGVHQAKANKAGKPLRVSIFVGGPPAHAVAAVMPLPEGLSELTFAGLLAGRRFRYFYQDEYCISADADFVITGEIYAQDTKPEGPFGDHLGYYSLTHDFPVLKVHKVYARENAIWPFTVVGRPPQEDTAFGQLIHELTGEAIPTEIPGLKEVHAVDAAGVHPLLLAVGSERYTPFSTTAKPAELLTIANRVLGTGQLSLAKYLFITAGDITTKDISAYFDYLLSRIDFRTDLHFQTNTTIDTLDYSGTGLNMGSKVIFAGCGEKKRDLAIELPTLLKDNFEAHLAMPGVAVIKIDKFKTYTSAAREMKQIEKLLETQLESLNGLMLIVIADDAGFTSETLNNFLWITFTRSNPSHDIYGVDSFTKFKHWGCNGPLIIDARIKPHHAPPLIPDAENEKSIEKFFDKGGSLYKIK